MRQILSKLRKLLRPSESTKLDPPPDARGLFETTAVSRGSILGQEDLQPELVYGNTQRDTLLTNLPPELRLQILSILELDQLRTLIHASPILHRDYRSSRRSVLSKCLQETLRSVTVDAYAVCQSSSDEFAGTRTRDKVTQFIRSYQDRRASAHNSHFTGHITEDEAISMAALYFSIIKPLARCYVDWALTNLSEETKGSLDHEPLSKVEEKRLLRALYRFQLCCNLFGVGHVKASTVFRLPSERFQPVDILKLFICLFEPWEVEEIACIYAFAREKCDRVFEDIRWEVHEQNPKFKGQRPPTPDGAFDFDNSYTRDRLLVGTVSRGLDLLHTVFSRVSDHAQLVLIMQAQITWPTGIFLENEAWGETAQWELRQGRLSYRERKQQRRDPLPFTGDGDSETGGPRPPLAWTVMWGGTYSNLFGYYVGDNIRRWGYVIWDAARLQQTGAKGVLTRQYKEDWGDSDPRDNLV